MRSSRSRRRRTCASGMEPGVELLGLLGAHDRVLEYLSGQVRICHDQHGPGHGGEVDIIGAMGRVLVRQPVEDVDAVGLWGELVRGGFRCQEMAHSHAERRHWLVGKIRFPRSNIRAAHGQWLGFTMPCLLSLFMRLLFFQVSARKAKTCSAMTAISMPMQALTRRGEVAIMPLTIYRHINGLRSMVS